MRLGRAMALVRRIAIRAQTNCWIARVAHPASAIPAMLTES